MQIVVSSSHARGAGRLGRRVAADRARLALVGVVVVAAIAGVAGPDRAASAQAVAAAGPDLVRLLRAMAAIKLLLAGLAGAVVYWRLGAGVGAARLAAYLAAGGAMAAGPGLIWTLTDVAAGAVLLHGGLLATILLLCRDPAMAARLEGVIAARRAALIR